MRVMKLTGAALALMLIAADQAVKAYFLYGLGFTEGQMLRVTPFLDLVLVWNYGMSFGLFGQHQEDASRALLVVALLASAGLSIWMLRAQSWRVVIALALVIGGALGNAIDRALYGAVADFFYFHINEHYWPAFNVADAAIVVGVGILLLDAWRAPKPLEPAP